ncbi:MAG: hypothetical protein NE328_07090 [Lentisphaeraceae bacterium]|nr:hypothetical protein [Lentisphaeraceae bacterium]
METNSTEQSQKGKDVFLNMVGLLGLNAEVKDKVSGRNIILSVSTDEPGRLIGRNGSSLDNVGLLMNRILKKTDTTFPKVIIDVDGYDKKPKREKRGKNNNRRDKRARSAAMEKTVVLDDPAPSTEDQINVYVDHETDSIAPVTTVALNQGESNNSRPPRRGRDNKSNNRRDNGRSNNRRDNNKSNNRNRNEERAPRQEPAEAVASASKDSAASSSPAQAQQSAPSSPAPSAAPASDKGGKPANKLQMQCRNMAKEVKRWGEDLLLPPLSENDCQKALEYFSKDKEVNVQIDNSRSYGDKKRVRVSLKK